MCNCMSITGTLYDFILLSGNIFFGGKMPVEYYKCMKSQISNIRFCGPDIPLRFAGTK